MTCREVGEIEKEDAVDEKLFLKAVYGKLSIEGGVQKAVYRTWYKWRCVEGGLEIGQI